MGWPGSREPGHPMRPAIALLAASRTGLGQEMESKSVQRDHERLLLAVAVGVGALDGHLDRSGRGTELRLALEVCVAAFLQLDVGLTDARLLELHARRLSL